MYSDGMIRSVLGKNIGPYSAEMEYREHLGRLFDYLYERAAEINENPADPMNGYKRLGIDVAITEIREVNQFLDSPLPVNNWLMDYQQFADFQVTDLATELGEAVAKEQYTGKGGAKELHDKLEKRKLDVSASLSEIYSYLRVGPPVHPPIKIIEVDHGGRIYPPPSAA